MSMVSINTDGALIFGSISGKPFSCTYTPEKYETMKAIETTSHQVDTMEEMKALIEELEPLTKESYKEVVESKYPYLSVNPVTNQYFLRWNEKVSSVPIPQVLVDKIIKLVEKNLDVTPIIKCWARWLREIPGRPKRTESSNRMFAAYIEAKYFDQDIADELQLTGLTAEAAKERATVPQVAITLEGLIVGYKVSKEVTTKFVLDEETEEVKTKSRYAPTVDPDTGLVTYATPEYVEDRLFEPAVMQQRGDAFYSGEKLGHHIRVGHVHKLESWDQVSSPGTRGLHCGGLYFIRGYQQEGTVTHNVLIDPMHIHSFAGLGLGNDGALTTKQYFVHSSFAGVNKNIYHSSKYAALTDAEYAGIIEEVVKATQTKIDAAVTEQGEAQALATI